MQRVLAIRVAAAYRTVSTDALLVVAGMIPWPLIIEERITLRSMPNARNDDKARVRRETIGAWQQKWDASDKGRWTHALIRDIDAWLNRKHGSVTHAMTQALTGHGCFNKFRADKIKKINSPTCLYCRYEDTAEHTLFFCSKWEVERAAVRESFEREPNQENLIREILASQNKWRAFSNFCDTVLQKKLQDEKMAEARPRGTGSVPITH